MSFSPTESYSIMLILGSGELLRCDVIVNHIDSLQIAMKTRELFIEDAPEEFYARALDDQGCIMISCSYCLFRAHIS